MGDGADSSSQTVHTDYLFMLAAGGRARDQASSGAKAEAAAICKGAKTTEVMSCHASGVARCLA